MITKYRRPKRYLPQSAGVSNDFFSVNKIKKHGSQGKYYFNINKKKIEEEELKRINYMEGLFQKEIHQELVFPKPKPIQSKNDRKHAKTLQKRIEKLKETEKFWPYSYIDIKAIEGKIVEISTKVDYDRFGNKHFITCWVESQQTVWDEEHSKIKSDGFTFSKQATVLPNTKYIGMATGLSIVYVSDFDCKPKKVIATQILFENKLFYIDLENLSIKSSLIRRLCGK